MAFLTFGHPKTITDLRSVVGTRHKPERKDVKIVVIDNDPFPYIDILRNHNFNIEQLPDLETLASISTYDIVLCDVQDVGQKFSETYQGAYLVKEIRKKYPFKYIISYTAFDNDARYTALLKSADDSIKKDEDTEVWVSKIDSAIESVYDVEEQWYKIRDYLLSQKVSMFQVALLENEFVCRIQKKKSFDDFPTAQRNFQIDKDAKDILLSFIGSAAVKLLLG